MQAVIYNIPLFGWMLREAAEGTVTAKLLFVINCLLIWALAIVMFGFPAIIIPALAAVAGMFVILFILSWPYLGD
ncbi:putative membrane protein [Rhizobium aquaticum]|uniref:Membrane protein n=1 Tax=Rhizobium aquaticum TaxID=1549636 RepID=A0ABV2IY05_9HYPH